MKKDKNRNVNIESLQREMDDINTELEKIRTNGTKLTSEITEHEKKECAFRETLAEADVIMANIEYNYTSKVKDLEEENSRLQQRILYHTETEQRLKQSLKNSGKSDSQSYGELLERLMET